MIYGNDPVESFKSLLKIIKTLRGPEGCPWDKKQTIKTILPHIIEETYECIDAVRNNDINNISEEIGDLYLLVTMLSLILEQTEGIDVAQTINSISKKLIRRHPHIFGDVKAENSEDVIKIWNNIKENIENREKKDSLLDKVPLSTPPLERAYKIQKIAEKVGFDWSNSHDVIKKIKEEISEFEQALEDKNFESIQDEFGDILFSVINFGRFLKLEPAACLHGTNQKFQKRFKYIEKRLKEENINIEDADLTLMEEYWNESKNL